MFEVVIMVLSYEKGFTLIELMATVAIASILLFMAVPSLKSLVGNSLVSTVTKKLYGSIILARSEAVGRVKSVSLCRSIVVGSCVGSGSNWATGWIVFVDENSNGVLDTEDERIREYQLQSPIISIEWNKGFFLRFNSRGMSRDAGTFTVCNKTGSVDDVRSVIVSIAGRARIKNLSSC